MGYRKPVLLLGFLNGPVFCSSGVQEEMPAKKVAPIQGCN